MQNITKKATNEREVLKLLPTWTLLLRLLKTDIDDDFRASDEDTLPSISVTIGFTPSDKDRDRSWGYQTGDNSFTGGAYGHQHWGVVSLYRRSNSRELARDLADQIAESVLQ